MPAYDQSNARDTPLGRDVAIKISAEQFSERFEREARSIAALNYANICHLYDVGPNYLFMELIEGETLKGPLPIDKAIDHAGQIAGALDAAHGRGIMHRDLKPANIKITADGTVKVLGFGLAKGAEVATGDAESSPTMTISPTRAGMIPGTAAYMAPEQARGKAVDKRADIWAFGVVVYEMLTGERLFQCETITDILASVVKEQPDLSKVPARFQRLLQRRLEKDPKKRLRDISDALELIDEEPLAFPTRKRAAWIVAGILALIAGDLAWVYFSPQEPGASWVQFQILPPTGTAFGFAFAISPLGKPASHVGAPPRKPGIEHVSVRLSPSCLLTFEYRAGTQTFSFELSLAAVS